MALKEEEGKGKIKRYWAVPILWIFYGITKLSEKIQNEAVRCGVKTSAYLYLIGIVVAITFYAVIFIIVIAIIIIIGIIIAFILGWLGSQKVEVPTRVYVNLNVA